MKTTILIKENRTQLVLHPESDHDKSVLDILEKMPNTHRTNLYDRQGGYTMFTEYSTSMGGNRSDSHEDLMIVFDEVEAEQVGRSTASGEHQTNTKASPELFNIDGSPSLRQAESSDDVKLNKGSTQHE